MAREIERKFLVTTDAWRQHAGGGTAIEQFYLFVAEDRSCRVRIEDGASATLTIKTGSGIDRGEFEYAIPIDDAESLRASRLGEVIEKRRYEVPLGDLTVEIDVFSGALEGLMFGEIELSSVDREIHVPDYLGREVTGDPAFTNARMALDGAPAETKARRDQR